MSTTPLNNTYKHISDESKFTEFDPVGTNFPANVTNVQEALALTSPTSYATTTQPGVITLATNDEVIAGIDPLKAVTPAGLSARLNLMQATTTTKGILYLATNQEAITGTDSAKGIVPSSLTATLNWWWTNKVATESNNGVLKLSTAAGAAAGVDDTTAMTPLKVKQAIAAATSQIPSYAPATESASGLVQLATIGQAQAGVLREGFAVSPYTLQRMVGSLTTRGVVQAATLAQANLGTDDSLYISAKGYQTYNASTSSAGTVKLSESVLTTSVGQALSASAKVLGTNLTTLQTVTGPVNFTGSLSANGSPVVTAKVVKDNMPVGSIQMWVGDNLPDGGLWAICDGGGESKAYRPELFSIIGYKFGGTGDVFYRPDMRGLFVRGCGRGRDIQRETGWDKYNKPKLGNDSSGGAWPGLVQSQQITRHKHIVPWGEVRTETPNFPFGGTAGSRYFGTKGQEDHDNGWMFANEGTEFEPPEWRDEYSTVNSEDLIGGETRPWNMSVYYIIKVA